MKTVKDVYRDKPKLFFVISILVFAVIIGVSIMSSGSYTFFSQADEEPEKVQLIDSSFQPHSVDEEDLPECVSNISYLDQSELQCFVQITCIEQTGSLSESCTLENNIITCDRAEQCLTINEWLRESASMCGC